MGLKESKNKEVKKRCNADCNDPQPKSYRFLDTSEVQSSCAPNMIKIVTTSRQLEDARRLEPKSTIAFLRDESCILFGSIHFTAVSLPDGWYGLHEVSQNIQFIHDLRLIDLDSGESQSVIESPVRDIAVTRSNQYFATLIYRGFSHIQLWKCNKNLYNQTNTDPSEPIFDCVDEIIQRSTDSHATCCSFSPNGKWVVLAVCSNYFSIGDRNHLEIYKVKKDKLVKEQDALIAKSEVRFSSLEFSFDSKFLAVGTYCLLGSNGKVILISTKTWKVILELKEMHDIMSHQMWGVFSPLSIPELICLTREFYLQKWDTSALCDDLNKFIDSVGRICLKQNNPGLADKYVASCPQFSPDGKMLAIPFSGIGGVIVFDPNMLQTLWTVDFSSELVHLALPNIQANSFVETSVCFSKSCEYLAVGHSCDAVSVWLLPRMHFTLKHFCRTKIISLCAPNKVQGLPIPEALKQYLLYEL